MSAARATLAWGALATVAYTGLALLGAWSDHLGIFILLYLLAWGACWGAARHDARAAAPAGHGLDPSDARLRVILVGAVLFRALVLPVPPTLSDDIFRYVWEGRVQAHGFDPFVFAPSAPELAALRDSTWESINNPDATAIYPPLAQLVFRALQTLGGVTVFKAAFCVVDLALIVLLGRELRRRNAPVTALAFYAWNPLVVVEVAGSGHLEPLAILPLVAALSWVRRHPVAAWTALAASFAVKYAAALLVPLLLRARRPPWSALTVAALVLVAVTLPFAAAGRALFDSLWLYTEKWRYNDVAFALLAALPGSLWVAKSLAAALLLGVVATVVVRRVALEPAALWVLSALVLLSPTVHPWYLLWVVALLPLVPARPLFIWSGSIVFAYGFLYPVAGWGPFDETSWIPRLPQGVPVLVALALGFRAREPQTAAADSRG